VDVDDTDAGAADRSGGDDPTCAPVPTTAAG
jgi:hypothetical protein